MNTSRLSHQSVCLRVGLSVLNVYCGKTDDWIQMPFGVVSGVGRGMGVLDGGGDRRKGTAPEKQNHSGKTNLDLLQQETVSGSGIS